MNRKSKTGKRVVGRTYTKQRFINGKVSSQNLTAKAREAEKISETMSWLYDSESREIERFVASLAVKK